MLLTCTHEGLSSLEAQRSLSTAELWAPGRDGPTQDELGILSPPPPHVGDKELQKLGTKGNENGKGTWTFFIRKAQNMYKEQCLFTNRR